MSKITQEAVDFAIANGLVKYNAGYQLTHAPFSLTPCAISHQLLQRMAELTPVFNALWLKITNNSAFLREGLEKTARTDDFVRQLLNLLPSDDSAAGAQQMLISRNDFLLADGDGNQDPIPKQVEFNTISNSFLSLSRQIALLHRHLNLRGMLDNAPVGNDPLEASVDAMAAAIDAYDHPDACLLMVVQGREQNIFDQRAIEFRLLDKYRISTVRLTLEEISEQATLREGHLVIGGRVAALTYFRAGYTPDDYPGASSWKARELIEASTTITCPSVAMQLAGAKKVQQLLSRPDTLRMFVDESFYEQIRETFVGLYTLDDTIGDESASETACRTPERFVLKPQREGGGNNLYGEEMTQKLRSMSEGEKDAYILMERIEAMVTPSELVVESTSENLPSISEIGRYGLCLAEGKQIIENRDLGYLVRTKSADLDEGGVCAGYACLNSLCLTE